MVVGSVAAIYFFWYVPSQRDYFASRNFRVLGLISEEIQKPIEAFPRVLEIAAKSVESGSVPAEASRVENAMKLVPALSLTATPTVEVVTESPLNLSPRFLLNGSWLEVEYRSYAGTNKTRLVTIRARCDLGRLANVPQEFDGLLIAQESGEVVLQRLPLGLNVQALNKLDNEAEKAFGTNLLRRASTVITSRLTGHDYKFFVQPLHLAVPMQTNANNWLVCGLVRAARFNGESLEASYFFLILCIFLVLFAFVSLVFPRVAFAGPREPLRRRTVLLLIAGNLSGAAFLTILLLDVMVYPFVGATFDRTSERLARMIRANFDAETMELRRLITDFDRLRKERLFPGTNILTRALERPEVSNIIGASRVKFDMAFWTDREGMQTDKWAVRRTATSLIDIRERAYVQDALNDRNTVRAYREKGANQFWIEPIYSLSTGENSVVLAVNSTLGGVAAIETPLQSLLRPALPSGHGFAVIAPDGRVLFHSEVRRNLRENLFDECDDSARLRSAVFSRANHLFDIQYLGRSHTFYVTPLNNLSWTLVVFRDRQLLSAANFELVLLSLLLLAICFVAPLALALLTLGAPWLLRSAMGRSSSFSFLPRWLWPDPRRWKDYAFLAAFNLILALCLVSLVTFLLPERGSASWAWWVAGWVIIGAVIGIVAAFAWLTRRPPGPPPSAWCEQIHPWVYAIMLVSLVLLLAVVPAFASFNVAFNLRTQLYIKHGQFTFAKALAERADRLKREHKQVPGAVDLTNTLRLSSSPMPWDVYAGAELPVVPREAWPVATHPKPAKWMDRTPFDWLFEKIAPLRDAVSVETRGLVDKRSQDDNWSWDYYPNRLTLWINNYREGASLELTTAKIAIPNFMWFFTFAAISLALLFPVCFVAHRVFLIHLPRNASVFEMLGGESVMKHLLVLREPWRPVSSLLDQAGLDVAQRRREDSLEVDCREDTFDASTTYETMRRHVILEHFEHGGDDPAMTRRKLQLLDKLISREDSRVIVSSARDPRSMKLDPPADPARTESARPEPRRWAELWRDFRWISLHTPRHWEQSGYRAIWDNCTKDEQLALFHVARYGLLHASNPELPILLGRGLLTNDGGLRLMTPGFHHFVRETVDPDEVQAYEQKVTSKGWDILQGPVYVALVGVALLMFVTQPEIYKSVFGIITAFTAGPPAILKLLSLFESGKSKKSEA